MPNNIDIFFDIGFTLMGGPQPSPPKRVKEILGLDETYLTALLDILFCEKHLTPESIIKTLENYFSCRFNTTQHQQIVQLWDTQFNMAYALEGALDLVNYVVNAGFKLHIVSNIWYPFYQKFAVLFPDIHRMAKSMTLSFEEGVRKPSPVFYKRAIEKSGATPSKSIMVGDSLDNDIFPCILLGMKCVWYKSRPLEELEYGSKYKTLATDYYGNVFDVRSLTEVQSAIEEYILNA